MKARSKEYIADIKSRTVLSRLEDVLVPVTKTFDVPYPVLRSLAAIQIDIWEVALPYRLQNLDKTDAVYLLHQARNSVVSPILTHRELPTGGEQQGNMLCIEDTLARIRALPA